MFSSLIKILLALNLFVLITALSCNINLRNHRWLTDWRLLVSSVSPNNYQLLRRNQVPVKSHLLMFCGSQLITAYCQPNGRFNINLPPAQKCNQEDSLKPVKIKERVNYCPYDLYRIGFNINVNRVSHFLEAYQVCFDKNHLRPLFVINKAYPTGKTFI